MNASMTVFVWLYPATSTDTARNHATEAALALMFLHPQKRAPAWCHYSPPHADLNFWMNLGSQPVAIHSFCVVERTENICLT